MKKKNVSSNKTNCLPPAIYCSQAVIAHRQCPVMTRAQSTGKRKRKEPKPNVSTALCQAAGTQKEQWYKATQV